MGLEDVILDGIEQRTHYKEKLAAYTAVFKKLDTVGKKLTVGHFKMLLMNFNTIMGNPLTDADLNLTVTSGAELVDMTKKNFSELPK